MSLLVALSAIYLMPFYGKFILSPTDRFLFPYVIWIWGNFDGYHYITIARTGYGLFQHPFFPLYPLLIKTLSMLTPSPLLLSALLISNCTFFLSLIVMTKTIQLDKKKLSLSLFLLVIIIFPTSFFYGAVYNDSLFLLCSSITIYYSRKHAWVWACLVAALATLTRLNGLALGFLILLEYLQSDKRNSIDTWNFSGLWIAIKRNLTMKKILSSKIYALALIPGSFLAYLSYTQLVFGNWDKVFSSMHIWNQDKVTFPLQIFWRYAKIIILDPTLKINYFVAIVELSFVIFYLAMLWYGYKKVRFSYWVLFAISILIPSLTGTFAGMPRYGLHIYPFFLIITLFLSTQKRFVQILYVIFSFALFVYCLTLFTRGYFIS